MTGGTRVDSGSGRRRRAAPRRTAAGRDPLADVRPVPADPLEPGRDLELEDGLDVLLIRRSRAAGSRFGGEPRALELQQDHLVDRQGQLVGIVPQAELTKVARAGSHAADVGVSRVGSARPGR